MEYDSTESNQKQESVSSDNNKDNGQKSPDDFSIYKQIELMTHAPTLWDFVFKQLKTYNLLNLTYYHLPPAGAHDFDDRYIVNRGERDISALNSLSSLFDIEHSFIFRARSIHAPLDLEAFSTSTHLTEAQNTLFRTLHLPRDNKGCVLSCHSANGRNGLFVLETQDPLSDFSDFDIRAIQWLCDAAHHSYYTIRQVTAKTVKSLSVREKQILTWVAKGKSNAVIAAIIGISPHTVNGYLRSIYLKTGTSDRTTAVLRGLGDGLIDL